MNAAEKAAQSLIETIKAKKAVSPEEVKPKKSAKIIQLNIWPEAVRGVPNAFLRSALFAAIQGKTRRYMDGVTLGSLDGTTLKFTGQQLDQSHLDVWEQVVHLARLHPLGNVCHFKAHALLKAIGRSAGKTDYEALDRDIDQLRACTLVVKIGSREYIGGLLQNAWRDKESGEYRVILDPNIIKLFYSTDWTGIDHEQRITLKGKPLALWLHGFYSTHAKPFPIKVETLHALSGSTTGRMRRFKENLFAAFEELESVGIFGKIDGDLVTVAREPTKAQKKHLSKKPSR